MINLLISKGAHVGAMDKKDRRPIHWAAYMGIDCFLYSITICTMSSGFHKPVRHCKGKQKMQNKERLSVA